MALKSITKPMVLRALSKFDHLGRNAMLERYSTAPRGQSTRWYILYNGKHYDQKLVLRAAHELSGLGPLPPGRGTFTAKDARSHLENLGFKVVDY